MSLDIRVQYDFVTRCKQRHVSGVFFYKTATDVQNEQCIIIKFFVKLEKCFNEIYEDLQNVYGLNCL